MFKKLLLLLLTLFQTACMATPTLLPTPSADEIEAEEQAVYTVLLRKMYMASNFVILDTTSTDSLGVENTEQTLQYALTNMLGVAPQTADSFRARNDAAYPLRSDMDLGAPYSLLSHQEMSQLFSENQNGWDVFYSLHPDSPGITSLSRVGFNDNLDQALVYIGTQSHWLAGIGYYVLMKKENGLWVIDQQVMTWIS